MEVRDAVSIFQLYQLILVSGQVKVSITCLGYSYFAPVFNTLAQHFSTGGDPKGATRISPGSREQIKLPPILSKTYSLAMPGLPDFPSYSEIT